LGYCCTEEEGEGEEGEGLDSDSDEDGMGVSPDEGWGTEFSSDGQYGGMVVENWGEGVDVERGVGLGLRVGGRRRRGRGVEGKLDLEP